MPYEITVHIDGFAERSLESLYVAIANLAHTYGDAIPGSHVAVGGWFVTVDDEDVFTPCPQPGCTGVIADGSCTAECRAS